ncbi:sigma factor [Zoogloea oleivorans]|uniref:sigma factor n=1 Tax=Zoogloea oleivorans TaxID=1552750 RepID=UPI00387E0E01
MACLRAALRIVSFASSLYNEKHYHYIGAPVLPASMSAADPALHQQVHALYSDHHAWLFGWLRKKLGCAHNAADVAQDTFLRIMAILG